MDLKRKVSSIPGGMNGMGETLRVGEPGVYMWGAGWSSLEERRAQKHAA